MKHTDSRTPTNGVQRDVAVLHPATQNTMRLVTEHRVSGLDLPPAFVYCVQDVDQDGQHETLWITDPVALSRYCQHHPQAAVTVMGTELLRHAKPQGHA